MSTERPGYGAGCARRSGSPVHAVIVTILFIGLAFLYYLDAIMGQESGPFSNSLLTGVHDLHRTLFLVPLLYAAFIFRVRGAIASSLAFLCIVLPRALFLSPYPDPLLRASISVASSSAIGVLLAGWRNRLESERTARRDLTFAYEELKEYHKRLEENQSMLIQAEKLASTGQLAASMAHEVNNPLSGVLVYIRLMTKRISRGDIEREVLLDYLSRMDQELSRCTRLIRNLLDFSSQSVPVTMKEVDVTEVIERSLELALHARSGTLTVERNLQPLAFLVTDREQLQAVLVNLMMNACQAMADGGRLTVSTELAGREARIAVRDTGCGIPPNNLARIFTPFFSTKKEVKGVGLGLSVSYGIVQRLNGRIEVESRVGEGSTFTVCLPLTRPDAEQS